MKISEIKLNPKNPRIVKDDKFKKLVNSIKEFPKMMTLRPIIIDENNIILGGNMRFKALKELGYKELPEGWVKKASELTDDEKQRFIIADNVGFGEFDWDILANEWDKNLLTDWGLDFPKFEVDTQEENKIDEKYTQTIKSPVYEPKNEKPQISKLYDIEKTNRLIAEIENSSCDKEIKQFLIFAAQRHTVFNYELIADFYAHSDKETQNLMENSALIIIDINKAIELGYVKLSEEIKEQYLTDYTDEDNE
jgi:hypothetical protein